MRTSIVRARGRRRGSVRLIAVAAALALVTAACGGDGAEEPAEETDTGEAAESESEPEADTESEGEDAGGEAAAETDFPTRDIRLVTPFSAGGGYDTQARLIAPFLAEHLPGDVNVVVDNMPGGDGVLAPQTVFTADPDGYMLLQAGVNSLLIQQFLYPDLITFDMTEFSWIGQYQQDVRGVAIANDLEVETFDELVALSEEQPLRVGGTGAGSPPTTEAIAFAELTGLQIEVIDYEGSAEVQAAFARGEVDFAIVNYTSLVRWQEDGDARLFMVVAEERGEYAPDTPTAVEAGMDEQTFQRIMELPVIGQPRMFAAPPGMPEAELQILRDAFMAVMEDPEYQATLEEQQEIYLPLSGEEATGRVDAIAEAIQQEMDLIEQLYGGE